MQTFKNYNAEFRNYITELILKHLVADIHVLICLHNSAGSVVSILVYARGYMSMQVLSRWVDTDIIDIHVHVYV